MELSRWAGGITGQNRVRAAGGRMDEQEVIQRVLGGDTESFRLVVERYAGAVTRMIRNVTDDRHTCEDLAQEVFLTAYAKLRTFDPARSQFSTWLFTIARNKAVNAAGRKKPRYMADPPEPADASDPEMTAERKELLARTGSRCAGPAAEPADGVCAGGVRAAPVRADRTD